MTTQSFAAPEAAEAIILSEGESDLVFLYDVLNIGRVRAIASY
jgi:hypothetical protein